MPKKRHRQAGGVSDPPKSLTEGISGLVNVIGAEVSKFASFDVIPDSFGGVEIRSVSRQPFNGEPVALLEQELLHGCTAMSRQVIPDQNDPGTLNETLEVLQEGDEALGVEAIGFGSGQEARFLAVPPKPKRCRHRGFGPMITASSQDRGFPARRPGPANRGLLGESGFVLEEDPGALASSVFFTSGQRTVFQYST